MRLLAPSSQTTRYEYEQTKWVREECYRFYVAQRRANCTHTQLMDLWLRAPYCSECIRSHPFNSTQLPDVAAVNWECDIECQLGEEALARAKEGKSQDTPAFHCKRCASALAPWNGDDIYIVHYHLEEHYQIPLETPRRTVSKDLTKKVLRLYDKKCFACGEGHDLHIDHILPRAPGGTAAFRNLQPLCNPCGQSKGDSRPEEVEVYSDIYFGPCPSDGYEGLFW